MAPPKDETPSDSMTSFLQRMYNPSITRSLESRMDLNGTDLIHVPWKLAQADDNGVTTNGAAAHIKSSDTDANNDDSSPISPSVYPSMSYLDLRRIQNTGWATDRLREGVRLAKEGKAAKAEECYKEGIDLVPTHAELFVAYGALCANLGRTREAIDKLEHALELDPKVSNAQAYINVIRNKVPPRQAGSVSRSQTAMKDALMERSFLQESQSSGDKQNEKYPLVYEEKMDSNSNRKQKDEKTKRKRRHHKKSKRKGKHRDRSRHRKSRSRRKRSKRHDSSSDDDGESDDSKSDNRYRRRRHRRHSSSEESNRMYRPSTDETSEESNRRRRRHRKRHKRQRHDYSSDASSSGGSIDGEHMSRERRKKSRRQSGKSRERSPESDRQDKGVK